MAGAVNYLYDVEATIQQTTGGDDGNPTRTLSGTAFTFKFDKMTVRKSRQAEDHSTGQDEYEMMRTKKVKQTLSVDTKLEAAEANLLQKLLGTGGVVVKITATALGGNFEGNVFIEEVEFEYGAPSTLKFSGSSYGTAWTIDTAAAA